MQDLTSRVPSSRPVIPVSMRVRIEVPSTAIADLPIFVAHPRYAEVCRGIVEARGALSLRTAAELATVSQSWFSHDFAACVGMPFRVAQVKAKLHTASLLLLLSKIRVSEVGYLVGYSELKSFGGAFKKHFHCSPRTYRASLGDFTQAVRGLQYLFSGSDMGEENGLTEAACHLSGSDLSVRIITGGIDIVPGLQHFRR
jgi:AraC-like DNA-binding protein